MLAHTQTPSLTLPALDGPQGHQCPSGPPHGATSCLPMTAAAGFTPVPATRSPASARPHHPSARAGCSGASVECAETTPHTHTVSPRQPPAPTLRHDQALQGPMLPVHQLGSSSSWDPSTQGQTKACCQPGVRRTQTTC